MLTVLLPTDFSENSRNAINYAVQLLKNEKCTFYLFNAYTPVIYHVEYVLGYPAQFGLGDAVRNTSQNNLNAIVSTLKDTYDNDNHKFETFARFETLVSGIKEFVEEYKIDFVVMGTKGATGAKEVLLGSNTVHVFKEIKCPILAVPSSFSFEAPHEILFPTDLDVEYNDSTLKILKELVYSNHARLNVLHVSTGSELNEKQKSNKEKLKLVFKNSAFLFHQFKSMEITDAINEFQIKQKINLLVMINNKHSFFENLFFKNKINQIGFHLNVPFLVIPCEA
ncbi:putative universal stress protein UspA [Winogradskyella psychrotolerans RS-3]|uniref:Putative universal stress protein UspA n=1 Tax=Winogradskyella psychrotolerans RS-3 TaxID=641526 RepID=S7VT34_9FLAO|nr:universal stress protein [Winogradskyella psychrotolerans]EPR73410.1 putative universal stress protein UspA [Winogradskyella psychrotolerans RS-3]